MIHLLQILLTIWSCFLHVKGCPMISSPLSGLARAVLLTACLLALGACSKKAAQEAPPRTVKLLTVGGSAASGSGETFPGEVRARVETSLGFRVAGKLLSRSAELGQSVHAGQVLAQLDPSDYRLGAQAAQAQVQAASTARNLAAADLQRDRGVRALRKGRAGVHVGEDRPRGEDRGRRGLRAVRGVTRGRAGGPGRPSCLVSRRRCG